MLILLINRGGTLLTFLRGRRSFSSLKEVHQRGPRASYLEATTMPMRPFPSHLILSRGQPQGRIYGPQPQLLTFLNGHGRPRSAWAGATMTAFTDGSYTADVLTKAR